ncbi:MAG: sugar phosphate isomerase/epimerase [Verrucomicrobia bacterium]|nr:sugar phosphate isomerase/epimerase [Verrucomicrobiota bacterium]MBI3870434.1 sugar phosphate isomerase/epimerase [Verrucomicrobiota bacterium]
MTHSRRDFMKQSAAALATAALAAPATSLLAADAPKRSIKKAIMYGTVGVKGSVMEKLRAVKDAGFEGVEPNSHMDQDEVVKALEATGLKAASVCCSTHWHDTLTHNSQNVRDRGLEGLKQAMRDAKRYGATSVLLVPGVVNKEVGYADAWTRSIEQIRKAVPLAEELQVKIAIENVWNNFIMSPLEAARFVDECQSPWVGWHFDIGNVINYGWPEQWIKTLGARISRLHIKEYSREKRDKQGPYAGFNVKFLEGSNDWPAVMKALDAVGYSSWGIAEQGGGDTPEGLKDLVDRMDKIFAS